MTAKPLVIDDFSDIEDTMMMLMMLVMFSAIATLLPQVTQSLQAQSFEGREDQRTVNADAALKFIDLIHNAPRTPWSWMMIDNKGPYAVDIAVNQPNEYFTVEVGRPVIVDRRGAQERISVIYYICQPTHTAVVRIVGEY